MNIKILLLVLSLTLTACSNTDNGEDKELANEETMIETDLEDNESKDQVNKNIEKSDKKDIEETATNNSEAKAEEKSGSEIGEEDEKEESLTDFQKILGNNLEKNRFILDHEHNDKYIEFNIDKDGKFVGRYEGTANEYGKGYTYVLSEFEGHFDIGEAENDQEYNLEIVDLTLASTPGQEIIDYKDGINATYADYVPMIELGDKFNLVSTSSDQYNVLNQVSFKIGTGKYYDKFQMDGPYLIGHAIIDSEYGSLNFYEIIPKENIPEDESIFNYLEGMEVNTSHGPSDSPFTNIEFKKDGRFVGDFYEITSDERLNDAAEEYQTSPQYQNSFEGKFDFLGMDENGNYKLKISELKLEKEVGIDPEWPFIAYVDYVADLDLDDEIIMILPGTSMSLEKRLASKLEKYYSPDNSYYENIDDEKAYGLILYNKTKDKVFNSWSM